MTKVKDILKIKGSEVYAVGPEISVFEALQIMNDKNIGGVLITNEGRLIGIFTERDYARKVVLRGKTSKKTQISELMTPNPFVVEPDHSIEHCMKIMSDKFIRHLPVIENDQVVGVISIGDVVRTVINEQKFTIDQLEKYIMGYK